MEEQTQPKTKEAFCAQCQDLTTHTATIDANGELVLTCGCGRFIKVPGHNLTAESLNDFLAAHHEANEGQVSAEAQDEANQDLLDAIL
jgi:RNase P subunit RPR2